MTEIPRSMIAHSGKNEILSISRNHILLRSKRQSTLGVPMYVTPRWVAFPIISLDRQATMFIEE